MLSMLLTLALAAAEPAATQPPSPVAVSRSTAANGTHMMVHEVTVNAPAATVWQAISTADGWRTWAVPAAWSPRPGIIETSYTASAKPGDPSTIQQEILFQLPGRLMLFRTVKAPGGFPDFDTFAKVTHLFEVEDIGGGRTRVRLTGSDYADTPAGARMLAVFDHGNRVSLENLAKRLGGAPAQTALAPQLAAMGFLAGHCWRGEFVARKQSDTHCFEPLYGGRHLRDRHEVKNAAGKVTYAGETLYSWNGTTKRVEFTYVSSDGGVSRGSMVPRDGLLDFGDEEYNGPDGKTITMSTIWRPLGGDAFDSVSRTHSVTGERIVTYRKLD